MTTSTASEHPYQVNKHSRRLYIASVLVGFASLLATALGLVALIRYGAVGATVVAILTGLVLLLVRSHLRRRAWWYVAWRRQRAEAEPVWLFAVRHTAEWLLVAGVVVVIFRGGSSWPVGATLLATYFAVAALILNAWRWRRATTRVRWATGLQTVATLLLVGLTAHFATRYPAVTLVDAKGGAAMLGVPGALMLGALLGVVIGVIMVIWGVARAENRPLPPTPTPT